MKFLNKILYFLSKSEKKQILYLLVMVILMSLLDVLGIASIFPFVTILMNPEQVETNDLLQYLYQISKSMGVETIYDFIFVLGILVFLFLLTALLFKSLTIYIQLRFTEMRAYSVGKRLFESYLNQPYEWFLNRNSSEIGKNIISEVALLIGQGLTPLLNLVTHLIISLIIIIFLIFINWKVTFVAFLVIVASYLIIYGLTQKILKKIGTQRVSANKLRFISLSEAFGAAKEVKINSLENIFIKKFDDPAKSFAQSQSLSSIIGQLPRYLIEAVIFGSIIIFILYIIKLNGSLNNTIPLITLFTFASYRLIPSVQRVYNAASVLKYSHTAINVLYNDFKSLNHHIKNRSKKKTIHNLNLTKGIVLNNISYSYPNTKKTNLKNINIHIPAKSTVGIIGTTGSGKTTLVDILIGLLESQNGSLKVDDLIISKDNIKSWQRLIGYIPQQIYLSDDTIEANIAFGFDPKNICHKSVEEAAKVAKIHNFIAGTLPDKYQTIVGERGVRLSGGQRQRLGIARAIYRNPRLLVLDEATSALDVKTETEVMNEIYGLNKEMTTIIITHRIKSLSQCDIIYNLKDGQIKKIDLKDLKL